MSSPELWSKCYDIDTKTHDVAIVQKLSKHVAVQNQKGHRHKKSLDLLQDFLKMPNPHDIFPRRHTSSAYSGTVTGPGCQRRPFFQRKKNRSNFGGWWQCRTWYKNDSINHIMLYNKSVRAFHHLRDKFLFKLWDMKNKNIMHSWNISQTSPGFQPSPLKNFKNGNPQGRGVCVATVPGPLLGWPKKSRAVHPKSERQGVKKRSKGSKEFVWFCGVNSF